MYPCIWFNNNSQEAAEFYISIFKDAKILSSNPMVSNFEIMGTKFMGLNGGPKYKPTSSISYFVYCGSDNDIEPIYSKLSEGGSINMPLGKYDWSPKYAWVIDKYGINWQLDISEITGNQKVVPTLLFANEKMALCGQAIDHYVSIFKDSEILINAPFPAELNLPKDALLFAQFNLNGFVLNAMSSTMPHDFDFSPGNSFVIECENQEEIDHYWENLGKDGHYDMCGWLSDKFGVSWQIVPRILGQLMGDPTKSQRVMQAFLKMQKFDIASLINA